MKLDGVVSAYRVTFVKTEDISMLFAPAEEVLPTLSELKNITIPSLINIPFWDYHAFRNAPKLTSLAFDDVCVGQIGSLRESSFPRTQITALRIDVCPDLESLFNAMVAFPNIHDLRIYIDRPYRTHHRESSVPATVGITTQILPPSSSCQSGAKIEPCFLLNMEPILHLLRTTTIRAPPIQQLRLSPHDISRSV